jgi:hypothetical protein
MAPYKKFLLEIDLGNEAMCNDDHIARALADVSERVQYDGIFYKAPHVIRDANGNLVGKYEVI